MSLALFIETFGIWAGVSCVLVLGLIIGSFLNVVIYRLPRMLQREWRNECLEFLQQHPEKTGQETFNLILPGSQCPQCHSTLKFWHNIPLLSYLFLWGKCQFCRQPISFQYPVVELMTALASAFLFWHFTSHGVRDPLYLLAVLGFTWLLVGMLVIDLYHQILPDSLTLLLLWLGLLLSVYGGSVTAETAIIGATVGYSSLWLITAIFKLITGKQGMGHGDFKLFAALGAWLGWQPLPLVLLFASGVGAIIGISLIIFNKQNRGQPIPFGPYLAIAGWLALILGDQTTAWLIRI